MPFCLPGACGLLFCTVTVLVSFDWSIKAFWLWYLCELMKTLDGVLEILREALIALVMHCDCLAVIYGQPCRWLRSLCLDNSVQMYVNRIVWGLIEQFWQLLCLRWDARVGGLV